MSLPKLIARTFLMLLTFSLFSPANFAAMPIPSAPTGSAKSFILLDFESGDIIAEQNSMVPMPPASITKIMTAYVIFHELEAGHINLTDEVLISERAWRMPGSRMFIKEGTKVSVDDLLHGMIIQSGNDASVALAEHVSGSEESFASWMNHHAQRMGLKDSFFLNATGLPAEGHLTTAKDMAVLARNIIKDFPEYYKLYSVRKFSYNEITQSNRNPLLTLDPTADGIKTGFTNAAGYCLVGSAKRDSMRLISVVFGAKSPKARARESQALLNFGFRFFETHALYKANEERASAKVWKGETDQLSLGLEKDLVITIPRGRYDDLDAAAKINPKLSAPIEKGQVYGRLEVKLDGKLLAEYPLIALDGIVEGSFWQQLIDEGEMYVETLLE